MAANVGFYERLIPDLASYGAAVQLGADLAAEIEGIAAGAGVAVDALLAMQARTELLAGAECSLIGTPGRVEQNWDWYPEIVPLVWVVEQGEGRWFCTFTEAGMVGKIGLSSAGLCFGLNLLSCSLDGGLGGVPVHVLLRTLLDRADTFDAAVAVLCSASVSASSCVTVGSADEVVAVELSPGGARLVRGDPLLHTNHFLAGPPAGTDIEDDPSTGERLRVLQSGGSLSAPGVCRHDDPRVPWPERVATLASVVMEPGVPRLRIADGPPCETPFAEVPLP